MASSEASEPGRNSEDTVLTTVRRRKRFVVETRLAASHPIYSVVRLRPQDLLQVCRASAGSVATAGFADGSKLSVILPRGFHPFPSRTRKLSPAGPMVLHAKVCGRVGSCRHKIKASHGNMIGLFLWDLSVTRAPSPAALQSRQKVWLGCANLQ